MTSPMTFPDKRRRRFCIQGVRGVLVVEEGAQMEIHPLSWDRVHW